jgi:hypothetical protein
MASESGHGLRLTSSGVRGANHLRSVKDGNDKRRAKFSRAGQELGCALLLLLILRALGQGLIMGAAGAALVLLLARTCRSDTRVLVGILGSPQLVLSGRHRVNHLWLHRTQDLARELISRSIKADGFVLTSVGRIPSMLIPH